MQDLTRISIPRGVLLLALPTWASHFLETSYHVVNGVWVGQVGTDALAAMNASAFFIWLVYSQLGVVSTGTAAVVANLVGAGRRDQAQRAAAQALQLALGIGMVLMLLGLVVKRPVLQAMGLAPDVVEQGSAYLLVLFLVIPAMALDETLASILRGYGDTRTPTLVWAGVLTVNIALLPVLVLGTASWPGLGVVGAGLATAVGMCCGVAAYAVLHGLGRLPFRFRLSEARSQDHARDILRVGLPTSTSAVVFCLVYMILTRVLSEFGTPAVAAVGIGHRVESLSYMTCLAFSTAAITMVGQNKGAGRLDRAERSAWTAVAFASLVTGTLTVVMMTFPTPLARVFTSDPAVIAVASEYIFIIGIAQIFMALDIVLEGAFSGAGNSLPAMVISIPLTVLRVPLAWYVAVHMGVGVAGVWWVITGLMVARGVLMVAWFSRGYWKHARAVSDSLPFGDEEAAQVAAGPLPTER